MVMLEPRRLAARSVAMRMAQLLDEPVGKTVGYRVRFENKISDETTIEVVTEGILTRKIQSDNALEDTRLVIFDEFHERSLQADLALALTLQTQQILRDDLRVLIMSATLDAENLSRVLNAPVISSAGRQHPVTITYLGDDNTPLSGRVARTVKKALRDNHGDVLVFLPGTGEIQSTFSQLENEISDVRLHPLFGDLPFRKQQEAITPRSDGGRKVVLATAIAETSLTIEGVGVVVDSGLSRVPRFDPRSGLTRLTTTRVTRDAADQRAGRAGRLGPGVCYRLWSEGTHHSLVPARVPEILEADLATLVLELAAWGVRDVSALTWVTAPPHGAVAQATELLHELGALEENKITPRGRRMATLPTHPRLAHMLLEGEEENILALATDLAAILEEKDPIRKEKGADIGLRITALRRWRSGVGQPDADRNTLERVERLALSWRKIFRISASNDAVDDYQVGALVMAAYPERMARQTEKHGERFKLLNNRIAKVDRHDPLTACPWIAVAQMDAGQGEGKIFLAAPLDDKDLARSAKQVRNVYWDEQRGMVAADLEERIGSLVISRKPVHQITPEERIRIFCQYLREKGLRALGWEDTLTSWQNRVLSLRIWRPEESWPDTSDAALLDRLEEWLGPFLSEAARRSDLSKLDAVAILQTILPWEFTSRLHTLAPLRLEVPSGSQIRLNYFSDGRPPVMEVRLQEMFGLLDTPAVNEGRTRVLIHLLSPGFKPVQVTQDLRSFWSNTYPEVRKELRTRYPKHSWPEDPWTAKAIRGAVRRR